MSVTKCLGGVVPELSVSAGRTRPLGSLRGRRQERRSKDSAKLLLLFDENILDNGPATGEQRRGVRPELPEPGERTTVTVGDGDALSRVNLGLCVGRCERRCRTYLHRWRSLCHC